MTQLITRRLGRKAELDDRFHKDLSVDNGWTLSEKQGDANGKSSH